MFNFEWSITTFYEEFTVTRSTSNIINLHIFCQHHQLTSIKTESLITFFARY